jgi:hypothetical protein
MGGGSSVIVSEDKSVASDHMTSTYSIISKNLSLHNLQSPFHGNRLLESFKYDNRHKKPTPLYEETSHVHLAMECKDDGVIERSKTAENMNNMMPSLADDKELRRKSLSKAYLGNYIAIMK